MKIPTAPRSSWPVRCAAKFPDNPLVHWRYGDVLRRSRQHAEAEKVYREVLSLIDEGKPGYDNRMYSRWSMVFRIGWMMQEQGDFLQAVQMLSRVTDAYENRGDKIIWAGVGGGLQLPPPRRGVPCP